MLDSDASTAKTLALVAIILQAVFFVIGIFEVIALVAFLMVVPTVTPTNAIPSLDVSGIIAIVFSAALAIGILWIALDYFLVYKRLKEEKVREAKTPTLVLGIIQLILGGLIPGILLIVAYVKIKDSLNRQNFPEAHSGRMT
jgi:nitrate reductase gamma subunit